jgi:hypothetical protein
MNLFSNFHSEKSSNEEGGFWDVFSFGPQPPDQVAHGKKKTI